jgi:nitric oxide reductase activation protein
MLDISFEPKSDVVKSLRAGKLDVCKIAEVPAGSTSIYKQTVEDQDTKPFGVCILADLSGSMRYGTRMDMQKRTLNVLYLAMSQIIPVDRLWIYGHTGDEFPEIYTFHTPYETNYALNIRTYDQVDNCSNYDGPVIEAIYNKVREVTDDNIIFISLSDGQPAGDDYGGDEDIVDMKRILERARRDGFVTVSVGMQYMADPGLYLYNKTVDDMSRLAKDVSQVVNKVVQSEFK